MLHRKLFSSAALTAMLLSFAACTSVLTNSGCKSTGPMTSQTEPIQAISGISASRGLKVIYHQCDTLSVSVEAPDDIIEFVSTTVKGDKLEVTSTKELKGCASLVTVTVKAPAVNSFSASSGSNLIIDGNYQLADAAVKAIASSGAAISCESITCAALTTSSSSGAALMFNDISATTVVASSSSGASINLSGKCSETKLSSSSGSSLGASRLEAQTGTATTSSGASLTCFIISPTTISASSAATIYNYANK